MYTPNFNQLLKVLRREKPDRPVLFEFGIDGGLLGDLGGGWPADGSSRKEYLEFYARAFRNGGYDHMVLPAWQFELLAFPRGERERDKSLSINEGALIGDEESFDAYDWPEVNEAAYRDLDTLSEVLADGMKCIVMAPGGVEENMINLAGYETLCFMQIDNPELVKRLADAIGSRILKHFQETLKCDAVGAILVNDDWGFKSQTMMPPSFLREYVIPWHRRFVQAAHDAGRPALMHSCGNLREVWDDIIDDIKFDGKHSYEDEILPVEQAYDEFGSRIAILGGIDMDYLCRKTPEEIYRRSAAMLERSDGGRGYALGSGNSIPGYVPKANYLAMIRAALEKRA